MKKFNIISKTDIASKEIANGIKNKLIDAGFEFEIDNPDLVIILGGDGKLLRTIHNYLDKLDNTCFVTLKTGTLGFSSDYKMDEAEELINDIINSNYTIEEINLLEAELCYYKTKKTLYGINEIRLENRYHTCVLDVYINDNYFESFRGNGLCISTPFGSTGYNKSLNGAVVLNDVEVLQMTEIAGIHNNAYCSLQNPLIVSKNTTLELKTNSKYTLVGLDHLTFSEENLKSVIVKYSDKKIKLVHYKENYTNIDRIKKSFIINKK